eukprot:TRINITY_DN9928_c0_g1_i1.p1 TRINITY_DN9928_c0_g1~~TRINITY_DN9928_c0_g1_i1.p1  ORF type:complete len:356 (-),score=33.38 TRINITY_DN9928_c0_g1_i1:60-1127(-)
MLKQHTRDVRRPKDKDKKHGTHFQPRLDPRDQRGYEWVPKENGVRYRKYVDKFVKLRNPRRQELASREDGRTMVDKLVTGEYYQPDRATPPLEKLKRKRKAMLKPKRPLETREQPRIKAYDWLRDKRHQVLVDKEKPLMSSVMEGEGYENYTRTQSAPKKDYVKENKLRYKALRNAQKKKAEALEKRDASTPSTSAGGGGHGVGQKRDPRQGPIKLRDKQDPRVALGFNVWDTVVIEESLSTRGSSAQSLNLPLVKSARGASAVSSQVGGGTRGSALGATPAAQRAVSSRISQLLTESRQASRNGSTGLSRGAGSTRGSRPPTYGARHSAGTDISARIHTPMDIADIPVSSWDDE